MSIPAKSAPKVSPSPTTEPILPQHAAAHYYALEVAERLSANYEKVNVHDAVTAARLGFEAGWEASDRDRRDLRDLDENFELEGAATAYVGRVNLNCLTSTYYKIKEAYKAGASQQRKDLRYKLREIRESQRAGVANQVAALEKLDELLGL